VPLYAFIDSSAAGVWEEVMGVLLKIGIPWLAFGGIHGVRRLRNFVVFG